MSPRETRLTIRESNKGKKMELCLGLQKWTSPQDDCNEVKILPEKKKEGEERVP
jgi:hypothetical protein